MDDINRAITITDAYSAITGKSASVQIHVWRHKGRGEADVAVQLFSVGREFGQAGNCRMDVRENLDEIENYVKSREILFRRFNGN